MKTCEGRVGEGRRLRPCPEMGEQVFFFHHRRGRPATIYKLIYHLPIVLAVLSLARTRITAEKKNERCARQKRNFIWKKGDAIVVQV